MEDQIKKALEQVRPALQADGGGVEFVKVENKVAYVKLTGACAGCPMSQLTLKAFIEEKLKQEVPELEAVEAV